MRNLICNLPRPGKLLLAILAAVTLTASAQSAPPPVAAQASAARLTPLEVVQAYVAAANRNDLDAFIALYAPDIAKYKFPATLASQGREHMREVYARSFAQKRGLHVEVVSMVALGDKVVSRDHVTGLPDGKSADELTVYQVENGLITNIVYLGQEEHVAPPAKN